MVETRITTLEDPRLEPYKALSNPPALRARGLFVAEGRLVVRRLVDGSPYPVHSLLLTPAARDGLADLLPSLPASAPVHLVGPSLMKAVAGFHVHRGCLGLAHRPDARGLASLNLPACRRLLVLEGVNNPDNVGGLFRNAAAFGVDAVVLGPRCGDPLYRKAIRTSMGGSLVVPFVDAGEWPGALGHLAAAGINLVALTPDAAAPELPEVWAGDAPLALLLGAEGEGLSSAARSLAPAQARIAMVAGVDSLNVSTAAAIALYHFTTRARVKPR